MVFIVDQWSAYFSRFISYITAYFVNMEREHAQEIPNPLHGPRSVHDSVLDLEIRIDLTQVLSQSGWGHGRGRGGERGRNGGERRGGERGRDREVGRGKNHVLCIYLCMNCTDIYCTHIHICCNHRSGYTLQDLDNLPN